MTSKDHAIVVGVESVRNPDRVLAPAVDLAGRLGVPLHVAHGFVLADPLLDAYARAGYLGENALANFGRDVQAALEEQVRQVTTRSDVYARAVAGPPVPSILQVSEEVDAGLIVVGASRHGTFPLSLLGSTIRTLIRRTTVPVLMMRPDVPAAPRRILAATDLSPLSAEALKHGLALGRAGGAAPEVRLLMVINRSLLQLPLEQRLLDEVAARELDEFRASGAPSEPEVTQLVRKGEPVAEILAEAESWGADLIVMGTHGRKGMDRFLLGSVAEAIVRGAPSNVLVVPASGGPEASSA